MSDMPVIWWSLLLYLLIPTGRYHDFHMSKTEVHFNEQNKSIEVSLHVFIDDLELAIVSDLPDIDTLYLATSKEHQLADSLIQDYLENHFKVKVDHEIVSFNFLGKEESNDLMAFWCYMEGVGITDPKKLEFENTIFTEIFDDQKNLIVFTAPGQREFFLLDGSRIKSQAALKP